MVWLWKDPKGSCIYMCRLPADRVDLEGCRIFGEGCMDGESELPNIGLSLL